MTTLLPMRLRQADRRVLLVSQSTADENVAAVLPGTACLPGNFLCHRLLPMALLAAAG